MFSLAFVEFHSRCPAPEVRYKDNVTNMGGVELDTLEKSAGDGVCVPTALILLSGVHYHLIIFNTHAVQDEV